MFSAVVSPAEHPDLYGHTHDTIPYDGISIPRTRAISESVQHLDISCNGPSLAKPAAIVRYNEPAVQLVVLGLLTAEDALYHSPLVVLLLVEYLGSPVSVGLAAVDRDASLFDIGYNPNLE